MYMAAV